MLFVIIAAASVAAPSQDPQFIHRALTPVEMRIIQSSVRESLSDPDSATFKMLPLSEESEKYCAYVNAKNRFGGYVGYRSFSVFITKSGKGDVIAAEHASIESNDAFVANLGKAMCSIEGYEMPVDKSAFKRIG